MITHPEKVLFPDDGITKGELAAYYEAVAPIMLAHIRARPVTMERYPHGIGEKGFFQKNVSRGFPEWLERVQVPKKDGTVHYPLVYDTRSLLWLVNQNCITPHVWTSRAPTLHHPDLCVFDLDPAKDEPEVLRATALRLRDLLRELGEGGLGGLGVERGVTAGAEHPREVIGLDAAEQHVGVGHRQRPARCHGRFASQPDSRRGRPHGHRVRQRTAPARGRFDAPRSDAREC